MEDNSKYENGRIADKEIFNFVDKKRKTKIFVEGGTYEAWGVTWAYENGFDHIYSVEINPERYVNCLNITRGKEHKIHLLYGDTVEVFPKVLESIHEPCFFWLDAHMPGHEAPLLKELDIIAQYDFKNSIIVIDDLRMILKRYAEYHYYFKADTISMEALEEKIHNINKDFIIKEYRDTLIAALKEDFE